MGAVTTGDCVVAAVAVLALLAGAVPAGGVASASGGVGAEPAAASPPGLDQIDFEPTETVIRVDLRADGSARWNVTYKLDLATRNDTAAFQEIQDDVAANSSLYLDDFSAGIDATVADAAAATGREMSAANYTVTTDHDSIQNVGYVTYAFTWSNFAAESGDRLVAGDALAGFFLESDTTLRMAWPEEYGLRSVQPAGDEATSSVAWQGAETTFGTNGPRVVVSRSSGGPPVALIGGILLAGVVAAGGVVLYRRRRDGERSAEPEPTPEQAAEPTAEQAEEKDHEAEAEAEATDDEPPAELLSNEERVLRLLAERGGRVKQQAVVEEFDWTAAKTSQVVGEMHEDGQIEKFRLGRENVLKLPDEDDGGDDS